MYKTKSTLELKRILIPLCLPFTDEETQGFTRWFNNQKSIEQKKIKRLKNKDLVKNSAPISLPTALNDDILLENESSYGQMTEITMEEKK
jgi:hypothetical protein